MKITVRTENHLSYAKFEGDFASAVLSQSMQYVRTGRSKDKSKKVFVVTQPFVITPINGCRIMFHDNYYLVVK